MPNSTIANISADTLQLATEQATISKSEVERGRVVVRTRVEEHEEIFETSLARDDMVVERVPVGRTIDAVPDVREEDGVLIVPVIEERAVVRTELVLKEEIRITRRSTHETIRQPVRLRAEHAEIVRLHEPEAGPSPTEES